MTRTQQLLAHAVAVFAAVLISSTPLLAQKGKKPGGGGGGDGGDSPSYTIIDLPGPNHAAQGGSRTRAEQIADVAADGSVYVLGYDSSSNLNTRPCIWKIDATGVAVTDIGGLIDRTDDINSAGIVAGAHDGRPALLLANNEVAFLADATLAGEVWSLNNPDEFGIFQAVGYTNSATGHTPVVWDVAIDGTVLATTPLTDPDGLALYGFGINDSGTIAGKVIVDGVSIPAVGEFDANGQLQISLRPNPSPDVIDGFWEFDIDDGGNVVGYGYDDDTPIAPGVYTKAVIWPASGGAIDLSAESGILTTQGNGIALVDGVMQVVGRAEDSGREAFAYLYTKGKLSDLNRMSQGEQSWDLRRAEGVNTAGMICGFGIVGGRKDRQDHGFLLIPN